MSEKRKDQEDFIPDWSCKDPVAQALAERGEMKRANRKENCAKFSKQFACPRDGHEESYTIFCELPTCTRCAKNRMRERVADYNTVLESIGAKYVTFFEIHHKEEELRDAQKIANEVLKNYLAKAESKGVIYFAAGVTDHNVWRYRVLALHDQPITNQRWHGRLTFLETRSSASSPAMLSMLFTPCIPKNPEMAAKMELAFSNHFRRLRHSKINVTKLKQLTDKSKRAAKRCPICRTKMKYQGITRTSETPKQCNFDHVNPPPGWLESDLRRGEGLKNRFLAEHGWFLAERGW